LFYDDQTFTKLLDNLKGVDFSSFFKITSVEQFKIYLKKVEKDLQRERDIFFEKEGIQPTQQKIKSFLGFLEFQKKRADAILDPIMESYKSKVANDEFANIKMFANGITDTYVAIKQELESLEISEPPPPEELIDGLTNAEIKDLCVLHSGTDSSIMWVDATTVLSLTSEDPILRHPTTRTELVQIRSPDVYGPKGFVPKEELLAEFTRRKTVIDASLGKIDR
jgi:hypothetical protein